MASRPPSSQAGAATGNLVIVLSILALVAALIYPILEQNRFESRLDSAISGVEAVRQAAERYRTTNGDFPPTAPIGTLPQELTTLLAPDFAATHPRFSIQWSRWEFVDDPDVPLPDEPAVLPEEEVITATDTLPPPPPTVGAFGSISVHSSEGPLLAGLHTRFAGPTSFVRDTTWTLVLPAPPESPSGGG